MMRNAIAHTAHFGQTETSKPINKPMAYVYKPLNIANKREYQSYTLGLERTQCSIAFYPKGSTSIPLSS